MQNNFARTSYLRQFVLDNLIYIRIQEQENIWEYYKVILQKLRTRVDNPYSPRVDGIAPDDNTQLYCVREALVNLLAHADYFSEIHSTVRVYDNSIDFQNAGSFGSIFGAAQIFTLILDMRRL